MIIVAGVCFALNNLGTRFMWSERLKLIEMYQSVNYLGNNLDLNHLTFSFIQMNELPIKSAQTH